VPDAIVVGSGPNGLAAAVVLARAGLDVEVYEKNSTIGGAARTAEFTEPGFRHDFGSAVHPMALASPFFRAFELERRVEFVVPDISYAHPLSDGRVGVAYRNLEHTASELGPDGRTWRAMFGGLVRGIDAVMGVASIGGLATAAHPVGAGLLGLRMPAVLSALRLAGFRDQVAPAMLAGVLAHGLAPLTSIPAAGAGLVLGALAHVGGWPIPVGGSQSITDALASDVLAYGGRIYTDAAVSKLAELPTARAIVMDVTARDAARIAGDVLPAAYSARLRSFRYGAGVFKVDFALSDPIPWRSGALRAAGTIHLGGGYPSLRAAESVVARGRPAQTPYILLSQPTLFDPSRAPTERHVAWAYSHVPNGSTGDHLPEIVDAIEALAPGFRDTVIAARSWSPAELEASDSNLVGGDIASGAMTLRQFIARPAISLAPWRLPAPGLYLCSSATPPGPGVHAMSGAHAARLALRDLFGVNRLPVLGYEA
jgi:phytoene dehydrogenase-like protein